MRVARIALFFTLASLAMGSAVIAGGQFIRSGKLAYALLTLVFITVFSISVGHGLKRLRS